MILRSESANGSLFFLLVYCLSLQKSLHALPYAFRRLCINLIALFIVFVDEKALLSILHLTNSA